MTEAKVAKMWGLFSQGISERTIAQKLHISVPTVVKYRRRDKWDSRRQQILHKAQAKADEQQVTLLAANMQIVKVAKQKLFDQIKAKAKGESRTPYSDLDRIIRLEEFLQGRPDSRPQLDYSSFSEEQLTIEFRATIEEIMAIPECRQELQRLLNSGTS